MQQSAGDVSYIKDQPGRFSLWRDNTAEKAEEGIEKTDFFKTQ